MSRMWRRLAGWTCALTWSASALGATAADGEETVRVFVLAGASQMEGTAQIPVLERQLRHPERSAAFSHLHEDGTFLVRDDVWIKFLERKAPLSVGFGARGRIGPELEFGHVVGDALDDPVLLIKTAWGSTSLYREFRPPSAGEPDEAFVQEELTRRQAQRPNATWSGLLDKYGSSYRDMITEVNTVLGDVGSVFPELANKKPVLSGLVWMQGWNDLLEPRFAAEYEQNLTHLIGDVRRDLNAPQLPIVLGQLGIGGTNEEKWAPRTQAMKDAQAAVAARPEFADTVTLVETDLFWDEEAEAVFEKGWLKHADEWAEVGCAFPYHYFGSPRTACLMGGAFADAMLSLIPDRP